MEIQRKAYDRLVEWKKESRGWAKMFCLNILASASPKRNRSCSKKILHMSQCEAYRNFSPRRGIKSSFFCALKTCDARGCFVIFRG